ncbi:hypothetical protein Hanom_Chr13g01230251 [Helianthus anomalus]
MRKNKPFDESHKTGQTSGTKTTFYYNYYFGHDVANFVFVFSNRTYLKLKGLLT